MEWGSSHQYRSIHLLKWDPTERGLAWLNPRDCQVPRLTSTHTFAISSSTPAIHWYFRSSPSWLQPILLQSVVHALHSWRQWYQTCKASSICHSCWSRLLWLGVHMFFLARVYNIVLHSDSVPPLFCSCSCRTTTSSYSFSPIYIPSA